MLDESALAKLAVKGLSKVVTKTPILKKVGKFLAKKPPRNIDPYFAKRAFNKGTMVKGFHGQSTKNIQSLKTINQIFELNQRGLMISHLCQSSAL